MLISELSLSSPDWIELVNVTSVPVDLEDWYVEWFGTDGGGNTQTGILTIPAFTLPANSWVVLYDEVGGTGDPPDVDVSGTAIQYHENIWWVAESSSAALYDASDNPHDFVRWGGTTYDPPSPLTWADTPGGPAGAPIHLGRPQPRCGQSGHKHGCGFLRGHVNTGSG